VSNTSTAFINLSKCQLNINVLLRSKVVSVEHCFLTNINKG